MQLTWDILFLFAVILVIVVGSYWMLVQSKPLPQITPVDFQNVNVFGHKMRFVQEGHGPHIVLVHGIGASLYVWRRLIPFLSKHFTVTAFDLLGFGLSDKPLTFRYDMDSQCAAIEELLNQLKIDHCTIAGSSMGGSIALRLAQMNPKRFEKVVTLSPAADPRVTFLDLKNLGFLSPLVQPLITDRFIKQIMKRVLSNRDLITEESLQQYSQPYKQREALLAFTKSFSLLRDHRVFTDLEKMDQPVLVLWGKKDKIIPIKFSKKITSKLKNMSFYSHPLSGHHPHEDEPAWTSEKITQFLSES